MLILHVFLRQRNMITDGLENYWPENAPKFIGIGEGEMDGWITRTEQTEGQSN